MLNSNQFGTSEHVSETMMDMMIILIIIFNCHPRTHHIVTPGFVDRPCRSDCTAGQMDGEAGWWTTNGNIGLPH